MIKALIALSGGMDSATVLAKALALDRQCETVGFYYGSKHNHWENKAAKEIAEFYEVPYDLIHLEEIMRGFKSNLMQGGGDIPEGHYEDESMSLTVVPGRNIIFASILAGVAWSRGFDEVWLGIHAGDHHIYPDCRPEFFVAMKEAIQKGTGEKIALQAPYLYNKKIGILQDGTRLKVPYRLTRTCYTSDKYACGKCGGCRKRLEAFASLNMTDPIKYEETE